MSDISYGSAAILKKIGEPIEIKTYPVLEPGVGDLILKVNYAGICGTDIHILEGRIPVPLPYVIGHEIIGEVFKLGNGLITDSTGSVLTVGDHVIVNVGIPCQKCISCLSGNFAECLNRKGPKPDNIASSNDPPHFFGGWAEYFYARKGIGIIKLPKQLTDEEVTPFACAGPTVIHAFQKVLIQSFDRVVVQGGGPVGLFCCLYLKKKGVSKVYLIDRETHRLETARALGVDAILNLGNLDADGLKKEVLKLTDGFGADLCVDCTGVPKAISQGLELIRVGGSYLILGQYSMAGETAIHPHLITRGALTLLGSRGYTNYDFVKYLRFISTCKEQVRFSDLITGVYSLSEIQKAIENVRKKSGVKTAFKMS